MTLPNNLTKRLEAALGTTVQHLEPLGGGTAGDTVVKVDLATGDIAVVKASGPGRAPRLDVEARMLRYLADRSNLPVPKVLFAEADFLVLEYIPCGLGRLNPTGEDQAADMIAALHGIRAETFGLEFDTVIGGLPQVNTRDPDWRRFFGENRLLAMAGQARDAGQLDTATTARLDKLAGRLNRWITAPGPPSLLHGDLWGGNVLVREGTIAGFVDPAIYYGDAEIELAYTTMFNSFDDRFYARYAEQHPIEPGFFEERCALYNLYPLLVHVRLFGGSYTRQVQLTLDRLGV